MIKDRGAKKWTALMLPEHVRMIRNYNNDEYYRIEKPILDEQKIEKMNELMLEALEGRKEICCIYYKGGHLYELQGTIRSVEQIRKILYILDQNKILQYVDLENIVDIQIIH